MVRIVKVYNVSEMDGKVNLFSFERSHSAAGADKCLSVVAWRAVEALAIWEISPLNVAYKTEFEEWCRHFELADFLKSGVVTAATRFRSRIKGRLN
jgi:hypothetical protein